MAVVPLKPVRNPAGADGSDAPPADAEAAVAEPRVNVPATPDPNVPFKTTTPVLRLPGITNKPESFRLKISAPTALRMLNELLLVRSVFNPPTPS